MDYGYEFRWPAGKLPYFITPSGVKVTLVVEDYVPYLRTGLQSRTARAVGTLRKRVDASSSAPTPVFTESPVEAEEMHSLAAYPAKVKKEPKVKPTIKIEITDELDAVVIDDAQGDLIDLEDEPELIEPPELSKQERLKKDATSVQHLRDHIPKNPYCESCQLGKMIRRSHGKKREIAALPTTFGTQISADHLIAESDKLKYAIKTLGWNHNKNTPGISQTNSVAERQIRDISAGTRALLVQAGLPACYWCYAAPTYCFGTNTKYTPEQPSAYALRFPAEGEWPHQFIPFGARVHFMRTKTSEVWEWLVSFWALVSTRAGGGATNIKSSKFRNSPEWTLPTTQSPRR